MKKSAIFAWILAAALISCVMFAGCGNADGAVAADIPRNGIPLDPTDVPDYTKVTGTYSATFLEERDISAWVKKYDYDWPATINGSEDPLKNPGISITGIIKFDLDHTGELTNGTIAYTLKSTDDLLVADYDAVEDAYDAFMVSAKALAKNAFTAEGTFAPDMSDDNSTVLEFEVTSITQTISATSLDVLPSVGFRSEGEGDDTVKYLTIPKDAFGLHTGKITLKAAPAL